MVGFDLFVLVLHRVQHCCFFDDVVRELIPFHQSVSVQIDVVEQHVQAPDELLLSVADVQLPMDEMVFDDHDEVVHADLLISFIELIL